MTNVIGFNKDPDRRQTLWNVLVSLREVREDPLQEEGAYFKQKELYQEYLDKYVN